MIGKVGENSFGQMIDLIENSFKYTAEDKQSNMKKNAAVEIVKALRNSENILQLSAELLVLDKDDEEDDVTKEFRNKIEKLKENVKKTILKAQEYDPSNKDVTALSGEITSGSFFNRDKGKESQPDENSPLNQSKSLITEMEKPQPDTSNQSSGNQTGTNKKSGCLPVILILMMTVVAVSLLQGV